jgi:CHAD domain-containing protein
VTAKRGKLGRGAGGGRQGTAPAHVERERKLAAWAGFELPDLTDAVAGLDAVERAEQALEATYYDTSDLRLARAGITVRFRTGEGAGRATGKWTVKLPEDEAGPTLARREIDVRAPRRSVPPEVASLVRAHVRSARLRPVGVLHTRRRRVDLCDDHGAVVLEVADDEVSVLDGERVAVRFRELEVELATGAPPAALDAVVEVLTRAGAAEAAQTPKIVRALGPRALEPPDLAEVVLDPDTATIAEVIGAAISAAFARLLRHDPGIRLGGDDEDVHQARVATRRLRSDLRTFRPLVDDARVDPLRDELQWLGAELGRVRDADVLSDRLRRHAELLPAADAGAAAGVVAILDAERAAARAALLAVLDGDRYVRLLDALAEAAARPPVADGGDRVARTVLPELVRRPWKHLEQAVDAVDPTGFQDPDDDEALHEIRIRAKRARYAAEAAAPVVGKPAIRFARAVAGVQGVLGDLQDAVVAEEWLRAAGAKAPSAQALAAGQLLRIQQEEQDAARRAWPRAWEEAAPKRLRSWLS